MNFKKLILLFALSVFGFINDSHADTYVSSSASGLPPSGYQGKVFDFPALLGIIQSNSVSSIDQLIPLLPDNYKKSFALMVRSGSLQSASPTFPRVISYGNYQISETNYPGQNLDRLYIGFQTDTRPAPLSKLPNSLEVIEWSPDKKAYDFYQVDFPFTPQSVVKNPTTCMECHGTPLRPNWTAYPRWDGAIGNHNQLNGIYNYLNEVSPDDVTKAFATLKTVPRLQSLDFSQYFNQELERPNANLSAKIGDQLLLRDVNVIQSHSDYSSFKYAIAGAFLGCADLEDFFTPSTFSILESGVFDSLAAGPQTPKTKLATSPSDLNYKSTYEMTSDLVQRSLHFSGFSSNVAMATWLRFIYEGQENPTFLKNLLGTPPTNITSPTWSYEMVGFASGFENMRIVFFKSANSDPDLGALDLYDVYNQEQDWAAKKYGYGDVEILDNGPAKPVCQTLAQKSRALTANLVKQAPVAPPAPPTLPTLNLVASDPTQALPLFKQYCIECHSSADRHPLPLSDIAGLKAYRSQAGESIAQRLTLKEMPLPSAPQPSDDVRKQMIDSLSK